MSAVQRHSLFLIAVVLLPGLAVSSINKLSDESIHSPSWTDRYDHHFRKYAKRYFGPHFDWRWFKSQGIAESGLEADAASTAGARGVMQILPSTYTEIRKLNPHFLALDQPRWNIAAGIFYDRQLYDKWLTPPPGEQRLLFAFGSYNAGYGRIYEALRQAPGQTQSWHELRPYVPPQTRHYVSRIQRLMTRPAGSGSLE